MINHAFERYAPFIQEYIYRKKWEDLRDVQVEACEAIMDTEKNVIVASGTASGKTEAAFFPILTMLEKDPPKSIGIMYIGPLKALINDQFERLNELLNESHIQVWPWHGDVSATVKKRAVREAQGVLQITPEALESLMMRDPKEALRLFCDLRFVVIDEIHVLMGADRGLQVLCLISRLEKLIGKSVRRIGLSATLNDYEPANQFLSAGSDRGAIAVGIGGQKRKIALCVESFLLPEDKNEAKNVIERYYRFIYDSCSGTKCLIFTNSRGKAEEVIVNLKRIAQEKEEKDIFYVHHGSISSALREETEHVLRDSESPVVAAATITLEMGIDIGDLNMTLQVGAPYTCSGFVQRLGRSGRRTGKSQMMFVNLHEKPKGQLFAGLPWELLRSIAVIQLYLEEQWVEPFEQKKKPFSLLAHQTLSTLMSFGELSPAKLAEKVLLLPAFRETISQEEYKELLRYMLEQEYIQRVDHGGLIVGLKGEKITNFYLFYSVFPDEKTYKVLTNEGEIGTLTTCPKLNEIFVLGGKSWQVIEIDESKAIIRAERSNSQKRPFWNGMGGEIHTRVVQKMKQILEEEKEYPYLQESARQLLTEARSYARENNLLNNPIVPCAKSTFYLCPWLGSKQMKTLERLLKCGMKEVLEITAVSNEEYTLRVSSKLDIDEWVQRFREFAFDFDDPGMILLKEEVPIEDKYDTMVPNDLLKKAFLYNQMDIPAAARIFEEDSFRFK